jgi:hypothetical protein
MIHDYTSVQVWEALEVLFPNDIEMLVSQCNREYDWDYHKDIYDILETLSDDAFINEVEVMLSQADIMAIEKWLNTEYNTK